METPQSLLNSQLTLHFFQHQIGTDTIQKIRKITFCGNDGDPIYCKELVEICRWIKSINPELHLVIITNGSRRTENWWEAMAQVLDNRDEIHWSIDGWDPASNARYRVNSDWHSIMTGMRSFHSANKETFRIWATIAFRFNEQQLEKIKQLARDQGMDAWQLTKSTKFGSHYPGVYGLNDELCPETPGLISSSHRFERTIYALSGRHRPGSELKGIFWDRALKLAKHNLHSGICLIGNKGVFLNSQGEFFPCCWTANRYDHNVAWHELAKTRFNLWNHSFQEILDDPFWSGDFLKFDSQECRTKCTQEKLKDPEHVTEW